MPQSDGLRIRLDDDVDVDAARTAAATAGLELEVEVPAAPPPDELDLEVLDPVTAVLIGGAAIAAGKFVLDWWERRKGGLIIDLRPGAEHEISRNPTVPGGYVLTFTVDGEVTIDVKDQPKDAAERLLGEIAGGAFGTVQAVVDAAGAGGAAVIATGG